MGGTDCPGGGNKPPATQSTRQHRGSRSQCPQRQTVSCTGQGIAHAHDRTRDKGGRTWSSIGHGRLHRTIRAGERAGDRGHGIALQGRLHSSGHGPWHLLPCRTLRQDRALHSAHRARSSGSYRVGSAERWELRTPGPAHGPGENRVEWRRRRGVETCLEVWHIDGSAHRLRVVVREIGSHPRNKGNTSRRDRRRFEGDLGVV
eukprot:328403-Rhodomonas_salina.2